jgi:hypothetical protein
LVPDERIVQLVEFVSEEPAFAGAMTMTWSLATVRGGTEVTILCENVPEGIRQEDHDAGLKSTLKNLARFIERALCADSFENARHGDKVDRLAIPSINVLP